ncbi:VOC family protein [Candidatus Leptofilum sp.]|uniref:VOC family protein n=1 Tax=Candidatus Leptofilum sp. TaxID=3241576 RepID=UPI003B5BB786
MTNWQPEIALIKIPVSNIKQSVAYYRDVIGLPESFSVPEYGWAQLQLGNLPFCLYDPAKGGGGGTPGTCDALHFAVPDAAASHAELAERGAIIPGGLETSADGMTFFDLHDPDGNIIKVVQRKA